MYYVRNGVKQRADRHPSLTTSLFLVLLLLAIKTQAQRLPRHLKSNAIDWRTLKPARLDVDVVVLAARATCVTRETVQRINTYMLPKARMGVECLFL